MRETADVLLIDRLSLRREMDRMARPVHCVPRRRNRGAHRLVHHHHAGTAAVRPVVDTAMTIPGEVTRIPAVELQQPATRRSSPSPRTGRRPSPSPGRASLPRLSLPKSLSRPDASRRRWLPSFDIDRLHDRPRKKRDQPFVALPGPPSRRWRPSPACARPRRVRHRRWWIPATRPGPPSRTRHRPHPGAAHAPPRFRIPGTHAPHRGRGIRGAAQSPHAHAIALRQRQPTTSVRSGRPAMARSEECSPAAPCSNESEPSPASHTAR